MTIVYLLITFHFFVSNSMYKLNGLIIVCIVIATLFLFKNKQIENYDAVVNNVNLETCAAGCKIVGDCKGFAYDHNNKKCYPSKINIEGKRSDQLYSNKFLKNNITCNKFYQGTINTKVPSRDIRRDNSIFECTSNALDDSDLYYQYNKTFVNIIQPNKIGMIKDIDYYSMYKVDWPKNKFGEKVVDQKITENIDSAEKENTEDNKNDEIEKEKKIYSINIEDDIDKKNNAGSDVELPIHGSYNISNKFKETGNIYQYGCVHDAPLSVNSQCKGAEWNPTYFKLQSDDSYKLHKNVCCLKKDVSELTNRDTSFQFGKLYIKKTNNSDNSKKRYNITI